MYLVIMSERCIPIFAAYHPRHRLYDTLVRHYASIAMHVADAKMCLYSKVNIADMASTDTGGKQRSELLTSITSY